MKKASKTVILKRLTMKEHQEIFRLSLEGILFGNFLQDLQLGEEKSISFTQRLLWLSKVLYTIRSPYQPEKIIGYALIYKLNNSFYESLCILSECYHPHIVEQTREQLTELAKFCYGLHDIVDDIHTSQRYVPKEIRQHNRKKPTINTTKKKLLAST